jgi:hypothetical protein
MNIVNAIARFDMLQEQYDRGQKFLSSLCDMDLPKEVHELVFDKVIERQNNLLEEMKTIANELPEDNQSPNGED